MPDDERMTRIRNRAVDSAQDAGEAIRADDLNDARRLLRETLRHLDDLEDWRATH